MGESQEVCMTIEDLCKQLNDRYQISGSQYVLWTLDLPSGSIKGVNRHGKPYGAMTRQADVWSYEMLLLYITVTANARNPWRAMQLAISRAEFGEDCCRAGERLSVKLNPTHSDYGRL